MQPTRRQPSRLMTRLACVVLMACSAAPFGEPTFAADPTPQQVEFFEKNVRPVLAEHCYKCHSHESKKVRAKLLLDSRADMIKGGESGTSIVPGKPKQSRLIEAIEYNNIDLEMPPKGKLPAKAIADLTKWVEMGAPWPKDDAGPKTGAKIETFDIAKRKAEHWAWRAVVATQPPAVRDRDWARDPLDNFILAKLEAKGLTPAQEADRRALIRRLYFDIIGLPPTPAQVEAFVKDSSAGAYEKVIDELLASPHFGERWGRHWLDLMRYAESRGHEFEPNAPNAYEYRDYVIRALNADLPYDKFVIEHIVGDLLAKPRVSEQGWNESIIGTGFWFLGEWVHSPVDIRADEADRMENMIDVMSKSFLGLTVACARCHDHKFDAISTKDFYALQGYLQSSSYRLVRFETMEPNRKIAEKLWALQDKAQKTLPRVTADAIRPTVARTADYLLATRQVIQEGPLAVGDGSPKAKPVSHPDIVFADFESGTYKDWTITGNAFGKSPSRGPNGRQQPVTGFAGKFLINTYPGNDNARGTATSKPFKIERRFIHFLIGGGAHKDKTCINLVIDGKAVRTETGRNNEKLEPRGWDVTDLIGKQATIQVVDQQGGGWGHVNVDHIVFSDTAGAGKVVAASKPDDSADWNRRAEQVAKARGLDADALAAWVRLVRAAQTDANHALHAFAKIAHDKQGRTKALTTPLAKRAADRAKAAAVALNKSEVIYDASKDNAWIQDGYTFGPQAARPGDIVLSRDPASPIKRVVQHAAATADDAWEGLTPGPGVERAATNLGKWVRAGKTIRTPTFKVKDGRVYYLVRGSCNLVAVVDSHHTVQGPLHGAVIRDHKGDPNKFTWVGHTNLQRYIGHKIHIEFSPKDGTNFALAMVVQGDSPGDPFQADNAAIAATLTGLSAESVESLAKAQGQAFLAALDRFAAGKTDAQQGDAELVSLLMGMAGELSAGGGNANRAMDAAGDAFVGRRNTLIKQIKQPSRTAMAMLDGDPVDEYVFIRGKHNNVGPVVPRSNLEALTGDRKPNPHDGSGRLELAHQIASADNPFTARVMANRVWHHLLGVGIVPSVDNFGVLGQPPTHPQLLDHLAHRFVHEHKWSVKRLIKTIVMSSTYRMASKHHDTGVTQRARESDPANTLLWRARVRRLEGEAIRDAILANSGRLDRKMFGRSVPVYLTPFMEGRGRPRGGPLDGAGRRSIYTAIRRNFLPSMMLAFDMPTPYTTVGRRSTSNVPAQALILMNDPFVTQQANVWAKRLLAEPHASQHARINHLYLTAFARPATQDEVQDALNFLIEQGRAYGLKAKQAVNEERPWTDLCHVLMNVKEFIFLR